MGLKISELVTPMLAAGKDSLAADWPKAKDYANQEFKKLAQSLVDIAKLVAEGKVNSQQAKSLLQIHKNTTQQVLLTVQGLGIIAVENAINAALKSVRDAVNRAAGVAIL
jgi:Asp-tRNA(Asn)/Glu-tRNA(Gln) amidotransferase B subunit